MAFSYTKVIFEMQPRLLEEYPPRLFNLNKQWAATTWIKRDYNLSPVPGSPEWNNSKLSLPLSEGKWNYNSLWAILTKVEYVPFGPPQFKKPSVGPKFQLVSHYFDYLPSTDEDTQWYLNFADYDLFGYYGSKRLAQDELQVLEIPVLGSIREFLLDTSKRQESLIPQTQDRTDLSFGYNKENRARGRPTPFLLSNVERKIRLNTSGLYGDKFASKDSKIVLDQITVLPEGKFTNIAAMAALNIEEESSPGSVYTLDQVRYMLVCAYSTFEAARIASLGLGTRTVIHTGGWGTGAFGNSHALVAHLQSIAAYLAGVDLVYHDVEKMAPSGFYDSALKNLNGVMGQADPLNALIGFYANNKDYVWGKSNGT